MKSTRTRAALAATATFAVVVTTMAPAYAEKTVVHDGADATASLTDIRTVRVNHADHRLRVQVKFPDLRRNGDASLSVYVDTDPDRKGPEFALGTPLFSGSDYQLMRMRNWKRVGSPVKCRYDVDLDWAGDVLVFKARRGCFKKPDQLRVGMKMVDLADASHPVKDWMIGRRKFTRQLASGDTV